MPRKEKAPVILTPEVETTQVTQITANAPKAEKVPKAPKAPKAPKEEKAPKTPKAPKEEKAAKAPKEEKAPKAPKEEKAPKAPKEEKAPKAPKEEKAPKAPKVLKEKAPKAPEEQTPKEKEKEKKKRQTKRQPKEIQVVAIVTPDGIEGTFTPEARRPLIVHFPFNSTEVSFTDVTLQYDPNPPPQVQPYDGDQNYFQVNSEASSDEIQIGVELVGWKMSLEEQMKKSLAEPLATMASASLSPSSPSPSLSSSMPGLIKEDQKKTSYLQEKVEKVVLLECYSVKTGETFKPPAHTDVHCFWCTHGFEESPFFLPVKEEGSVYHVYGNFCTAQCALAYLLYEHMDSHVRWERMALLHRMYRCVGRLYPAPPRDSLTSYGGKYTIDKFREIISHNRVRVDVQVPPMVSILGTLDTKPIDFYDSSLQNTFTQGFSMDRFKAWSEQGGALRLKRSKPLKDHDSTLDACINISVKRGGE